MALAGTLLVRIAADVAQFEEALRGVDAAMRRAEAGSRMLLGGVVALGAGMIAAGTKGVQLAAQMEQSRIAFKTLLGDAQRAEAFLRELFEFAARTPFEFRGLQDTARQLLAFGFQAEQIVPMLTSIGDAVAALGGGEVEIQRVVRALGQIQGKGKVTAEEMMQIAELGIPAWELLAQKLGVSIPEAMDRVSKGGVDAATGINAILEGLSGRFAGAMAAQSETLLGLWSTAKDNLTGILAVLGEQLAETFDLKERLASALEWLSKLSALLQEEGLQGALAKLFPPERQRVIVLIAGAIAGALIPALYGLASAFVAATLPLAPFMLAGAAIAGLAFLIIRNWEPLRETFTKLWEDILRVFGRAKAVVVDVIEAVSAPIRGLIELIQRALAWLDRLFGATAKGPKLGPTLPPAPPGGVPGMAHGGQVVRPGLAFVGERGPELVTLPRGAEVRPLRAAAGGVEIGRIDVTVYEASDPEKVARIVQRTMTDTLRRLVLEGA